MTTVTGLTVAGTRLTVDYGLWTRAGISVYTGRCIGREGERERERREKIYT